jgi:hypothetical protein|tara:strand:+ start:3854 stop:4285 length:432 start_codon:yes stop_codon:yes gene_type:complete
MGNYSYTSNTEGCDIDVAKLKKLCKERDIEEIQWIVDQHKKSLEEDDLGDWISGWKIQGYWYKSFCKFLLACAESMNKLTDDMFENYIEMTEEQGFPFSINFHLDEDNKPSVTIRATPMEWQEFNIRENGSLEDLPSKWGCID